VVVDRRVQIESGFTVERTDETHRTITAPEPLVRIGVTSRFELRVANDGVTNLSTLTPSGWQGSTGRSDTEVGFKLQLFGRHRCGNVSVIPFLSMPTGSPDVRGHWDPGIEFAGGVKLSDSFDLSGTLKTIDRGRERSRQLQPEFSASLEHDFLERFGVFAEIDDSCESRCGTSIDGGLTIGVGARKNAQLDVEAGHRVHGDAPNWFVGGGYVWRTPLRMRRR